MAASKTDVFCFILVYTFLCIALLLWIMIGKSKFKRTKITMRLTAIHIELLFLLTFALVCCCIYLICWIFAYLTSWWWTVVGLFIGYRYLYGYASPNPEEINERKDLFVVVVGAGFSGICTAIQLKRQRIPFVVLEKSSHIGGTWWDNKYPGCACDVSAHLYDFSFYTNPFWSRLLATQSDLLKYLGNACEYFSLYSNIKLNIGVEKCEFNTHTKQWKVFTSNGEEIKCNFLISGIGGLQFPNIPKITGQEKFSGESFHTALWKKDYSYSGKSVGVIGTGASSVQVVPSIAPHVKNLYVFQRTPIWIFPRFNPPCPSLLRKIFHMFPFILQLYRWYLFVKFESIYHLNFTTGAKSAKLIRKILEFYLKQEVKDPALHSKLIPNYDIGCKRIGISSEYLETYNRPNVTLVDQPIENITEKGIKIKDRDEPLLLDTIIYATGFAALNFGNLNIHRPEDNKTLAEIWGNTPKAYKGIMYPGFPNLFILMGPNALLGHSSVVWMMECQVDYVIQAITYMNKKGLNSIEVKEEVNEEYQSYVKKKMKHRVFGSGIQAWYRNDDGHNFTLWPCDCVTYWWKTLRVNFNNFITQ